MLLTPLRAMKVGTDLSRIVPCINRKLNKLYEYLSIYLRPKMEKREKETRVFFIRRIIVVRRVCSLHVHEHDQSKQLPYDVLHNKATRTYMGPDHLR